MIHIQCPTEFTNEQAREASCEGPNKRKTLFMGGGITSCPPWQEKMLTLLSNVDNLVVFNPKRENFDISQPDVQNKQVRWEHRHLHMADARMFWFSNATLCPITLFEYGYWLCQHKNDRYAYHQPLFVGIEPGYLKVQDIAIQTDLANELTFGPHKEYYIKPVFSLLGLAAQVKEWARHNA